jgi:hypothetical protein
MPQWIDYSQPVGTTPVRIFHGLSTLSPGVRRMRIRNSGGPDGPTIWLTRVGSSPAPFTAGSYPLVPGELEEHVMDAGGVNQPPTNDLWAISEAAGGQITAEIGQ